MYVNRYGFLRRLLHWAVGLMVLGLLAVGFLFYYTGLDSAQFKLGDDTMKTLYHYHKSFGVVVLGLAVLWIWIRQASGVPKYDPPVLFFFRIPAWIVHTTFFVLLIAMPLVGWLATSAGGYPVAVFDYPLPALIGKDEALSTQLFWLHRMIGVLLVALVGIHLLATIFHKKVARDTVMKRMSIW